MRLFMVLGHCEECGAHYLGRGDFANGKGQFIRMGERSADTCKRCMEIGDICGPFS